MTLVEALNNNDMNNIIDSMNAYVYSRIKTIGVKDLEGKSPEDFVGEVLMKVAEGERDWFKAKCSFKEFLFGCLKSHLNNFFKAFDEKYASELLDNESKAVPEDVSEEKLILIKKLKQMGADQDELDMLECWLDCIYKPSEIADFLGKDIKAIHNIKKRLDRKLLEIRPQIIKLI